MLLKTDGVYSDKGAAKIIAVIVSVAPASVLTIENWKRPRGLYA